MRTSGFDHSSFNSESDMNTFFRKFGISKEPKLIGSGLGFRFIGESITCVFLYDPFTGTRSGQSEPSREIGFLGYVRIEGEEKDVALAVDFFKKNVECGEYDKDGGFI